MLNKNFDNILQKKVFQILLESVQRTDIESYLVGGVVRDHLLGRGKAKDIDVVAVGSGIELAKAVHQALPGARPIQVFKSYVRRQSILHKAFANSTIWEHAIKTSISEGRF